MKWSEFIITPSFADFVTSWKKQNFCWLLSTKYSKDQYHNNQQINTNHVSFVHLTCDRVHLRFQTLHKISETLPRHLSTICPEISEQLVQEWKLLFYLLQWKCDKHNEKPTYLPCDLKYKQFTSQNAFPHSLGVFMDEIKIWVLFFLLYCIWPH